MDDCKRELASLLVEERLAGASLLVLANKQDLPSSASAEEIEQKLKIYLLNLSALFQSLTSPVQTPTSALDELLHPILLNRAQAQPSQKYLAFHLHL
ncbi:unnamed protein product [Gongylonema pulchrum]|uniref:GTP-binding protein n=1 Tax=Gongylonema pulchrum TaxID=637853 RepID=A0A183EI50_9BILA|nr:unnamed protein product [Gongylonema pulchrum]